MARVRRNIIIEGISGKLGGQLVFRNLKDGRTIVCAAPDFSNRVLSTQQKAHHSKFKAGAAYAKAAAKTQPIYAELAAGTMKTAYNIALADYFHPPVIHEVKREGSRLKIHASDDVLVTGVTVTVFGTDGKVLEKGEAVKGDSDWWEYIPQATGKILMEARDLAGNVTKAEMEGKK
jgi:hypothetical protein